jgi:hypothetical protein
MRMTLVTEHLAGAHQQHASQQHGQWLEKHGTIGAPNACSFLPGVAWRAARALGYRRLVTDTLAAKPGSSLRAAGWRLTGQVAPRSWSWPSRPRTDTHPLVARCRWEIAA